MIAVFVRDRISFKLSLDSKDPKDHIAGGPCGIDPLAQAHQIKPVSSQSFADENDIPSRSRKTIKTVHSQGRVPVAGHRPCFLQIWTNVWLTARTPRFHVLPNLLHKPTDAGHSPSVWPKNQGADQLLPMWSVQRVRTNTRQDAR